MGNTVFLDTHSLDRNDLEWRSLLEITPQLARFPATAPDQTMDRIRDAEIIISNKVILDAPVLAQAHKLKLICVAATGTNNVDLDYCQQLGITVCNVRDYATASVVQHTFTLILALSTRLLDYQQAIHRGDWSRSDQFCLLDFPIAELQGKTLGIIGYGVLGKAVADLAHAFGMSVLISNRPGSHDCPLGRTPFDSVIAESDIISLHCPLADNTRKLISAQVLEKMQDHALLINTARGGLIDEDALAQALRNDTIGGAGLDVLSQEPPPENHILLSDNIPNLVITPHTAWASQPSRQRLLNQLADNICAFLNGQPRNVVT
jgi:glycerate dehydrogenase